MRHLNPDRDKLAKEAIEMLSDKPSEMKPSAAASKEAADWIKSFAHGPEDERIESLAELLDAFAAERVRPLRERIADLERFIEGRM